jgi:hypothetical protein
MGQNSYIYAVFTTSAFEILLQSCYVTHCLGWGTMWFSSILCFVITVLHGAQFSILNRSNFCYRVYSKQHQVVWNFTHRRVRWHKYTSLVNPHWIHFISSIGHWSYMDLCHVYRGGPIIWEVFIADLSVRVNAARQNKTCYQNIISHNKCNGRWKIGMHLFLPGRQVTTPALFKLTISQHQDQDFCYCPVSN